MPCTAPKKPPTPARPSRSSPRLWSASTSPCRRSGSRWTQVSADSGTTSGSQFDRDIRLREVIQDILTAQIGGEHFAKDGKSLDWAIGTSRASETRPGALTMSFRQSGMTLGYNFADADRPRANVSVDVSAGGSGSSVFLLA